jgi:hypothetical protein
MTENYDRLEDNRNIVEAESEWESAVAFSDGSNTYRLVRTLLTLYDSVDENIEDVYEQTHINSATGAELDQFGELVNVERKTNGSDNKYRARIKAFFRASTIGTTYNQFTEFVAETLNSDIQNFTFTTPHTNQPATVVVAAQGSVYQSVGFSNEEIVELLSKGVPAGHEVTVVEGGTFSLKSDGDGDDPDKGLTSDSIETGGTVAGEII